MVALDFRFGGRHAIPSFTITLSRCAALSAQAPRRSIRPLPGCSVRLEQLGEPPVDRAHWLRNVTTIAAYRDRHGITSPEPLGGQPASDNQRVDRARAEAALRRLRGVASPAPRADQLGPEAGLGR